jgi:acyl carrier protein
MTTTTDVRDTVVAALTSEAESDAAPSTVGDSTALGADGLALNSLGFVRAMVALEDQLGIELEDAVVMSSDFEVVGDVVRFVQGQAGGGGSP